MSAHSTYRPGGETEPDFRRIARKIGAGLRQSYAHPETVQLPADHVDLLLRLRHKERDRRPLDLSSDPYTRSHQCHSRPEPWDRPLAAPRTGSGERKGTQTTRRTGSPSRLLRSRRG